MSRCRPPVEPWPCRRPRALAILIATAVVAGPSATAAGRWDLHRHIRSGDRVGRTDRGPQGHRPRQRQGRGAVRRAAGIHIHAVGSCARATFDSAGGHYNPLAVNTASRTRRPARRRPAEPCGRPRRRGTLNAKTDRVTLSSRRQLFDADGSRVHHPCQPGHQSTDPGNGGSGPGRLRGRRRGLRASGSSPEVVHREPGNHRVRAVRRTVPVHPCLAERWAEARLRDHDRRRGDLRCRRSAPGHCTGRWPGSSSAD